MKSRLLNIIGILCLTAVFAGCSHIQPHTVNLTPELMPTNPSGIYTFTLLVDLDGNSKKTIGVNVVIGGSIYPMQRKSDSGNVFIFDYSIPSNINQAKYYFEILDDENVVVAKSDIYELKLTNRYVVELESNRAQPGKSISVLGKGFRSEDKIRFGEQSLEVRFMSGNQLQFDVPAVEGGVDYEVALETSSGNITIGTFRVDYSELRSMPARLVLLEGQTVTIVFSVDNIAPPGGVHLDIDLSEASLLEFVPVSIEEGVRSQSMQVTGGAPGNGSLIVKAAAHNQLEIPVEVKSRVLEE